MSNPQLGTNQQRGEIALRRENSKNKDVTNRNNLDMQKSFTAS